MEGGSKIGFALVMFEAGRWVCKGSLLDSFCVLKDSVIKMRGYA